MLVSSGLPFLADFHLKSFLGTELPVDEYKGKVPKNLGLLVNSDQVHGTLK